MYILLDPRISQSASVEEAKTFAESDENAELGTKVFLFTKNKLNKES